MTHARTLFVGVDVYKGTLAVGEPPGTGVCCARVDSSVHVRCGPLPRVQDSSSRANRERLLMRGAAGVREEDAVSLGAYLGIAPIRAHPRVGKETEAELAAGEAGRRPRPCEAAQE
jgi:hypothetical protein